APPRPYAWLALGSHGRREVALGSDQDSALAYADAGPAAAQYFALLAEHVVGGLERAGLPRCDGGFTATRWAQPVGELHAMFRRWVEAPDPEALVRAEVFLDVRRVHGALDVGVLPRTLAVGGQHGPFLAQLARAAVHFRPPLTVFGRVRTDHGVVDVKHAGTAPVVLLARLYALAGGVVATGTAERLAGAAAAGTLSRQGAADLDDAYRFLLRLRLRHHVRLAGTGARLDDRVRVDALPAGERERLRAVLRLVRDVQASAELRFAVRAVT
ncbi:MAG TPA: putative nucleotidyltransferase substrate binding domain-containing protein, partial [Mycobacteriales bacterium]|nr:putative nucleotidyltransferase substrate binding domain-containing protein [Mycobacteriales bacterium]